MAGRSQPFDPEAAASVGITRLDYGLTSATPLDAESHFYSSPTLLEVDVHEGVEVGLLLAGRMERHPGGRVVPVLPGDAWLCAAWEPHGWRVIKPGTRDVVLIFLPEFLGEERLGRLSWLSPFAVPADQRPRVTSAAVRQKLLGVGQEMLQEIRGKGPAWHSAIRLELLRALLTLCREWKPAGQAEHSSQLSAGTLTRVRPALGLVQARPAQPPPLREAAQVCGLSRSQFSLAFRSAMGLSYGRFCRRLRLGLVAQLLLATEYPIAAIAAETGFVDASHLHRAFFKQYGYTPRAYRLEHRPQW